MGNGSFLLYGPLAGPQNTGIAAGRRKVVYLMNIYPEVAAMDSGSIRFLCDEYLRNNYIDPETSERLGVKRGLRNPDGTGVLAGLTNICDVVGYRTAETDDMSEKMKQQYETLRETYALPVSITARREIERARAFLEN